MCSTINMDQQQQYVQSTSGTEGQSGGDAVVGSASELPPDISQMDFQTIKAASDTLKVSELLLVMPPAPAIHYCLLNTQPSPSTEFQITVFPI